MEGFRQAHLRDGIALTRYFSWLERQLDAGILVTESSGADYLESLRRFVPLQPPPSQLLIQSCRELPLFKGLSFPTISSTGAHASIIHYSPVRPPSPHHFILLTPPVGPHQLLPNPPISNLPLRLWRSLLRLNDRHYSHDAFWDSERRGSKSVYVRTSGSYRVGFDGIS